MDRKITIDYSISEEELDPQDIAGGICLRIDGDRVNRFQDEGSYDPILDWEPEYVGEYLHADFKRLIDRSRRIALGDVEIYDQVTVRFDPNTVYLIFEPVSPQRLRVAYRNQRSDDVPLVAPKSACGYVVDR